MQDAMRGEAAADEELGGKAAGGDAGAAAEGAEGGSRDVSGVDLQVERDHCLAFGIVDAANGVGIRHPPDVARVLEVIDGDRGVTLAADHAASAPGPVRYPLGVDEASPLDEPLLGGVDELEPKLLLGGVGDVDEPEPKLPLVGLLDGVDEVDPKLELGLVELMGFVGEVLVLKLPYVVSPWSPMPSRSRPNEFHAQ
jgi:hypothetical protein